MLIQKHLNSKFIFLLIFLIYMSMPVKGDTTQKVIVIGAGVTLRDAPEKTAKNVGVLSFGNVINYVGQDKEWSKVVTQDNVEGWVLTVFLNLFDPAKKEAIFLKVAQNKFSSSQQSFGNLVEIVNFIKKLEVSNLAGSELLTLKNKVLKQSFKIIPSDKVDQLPYSEWLLAYKKPSTNKTTVTQTQITQKDKKIVKTPTATVTNTNNKKKPLTKQQIKREQRVALIIGNSHYQKPLPELNNPINDAKAIKSILETRGFNVIYEEDVSATNLKRDIQQFQRVRKHTLSTISRKR